MLDKNLPRVRHRFSVYEVMNIFKEFLFDPFFSDFAIHLNSLFTDFETYSKLFIIECFFITITDDRSNSIELLVFGEPDISTYGIIPLDIKYRIELDTIDNATDLSRIVTSLVRRSLNQKSRGRLQELYCFSKRLFSIVEVFSVKYDDLLLEGEKGRNILYRYNTDINFDRYNESKFNIEEL